MGQILVGDQTFVSSTTVTQNKWYNLIREQRSFPLVSPRLGKSCFASTTAGFPLSSPWHVFMHIPEKGD